MCYADQSLPPHSALYSYKLVYRKEFWEVWFNDYISKRKYCAPPPTWRSVEIYTGSALDVLVYVYIRLARDRCSHSAVTCHSNNTTAHAPFTCWAGMSIERHGTTEAANWLQRSCVSCDHWSFYWISGGLKRWVYVFLCVLFYKIGGSFEFFMYWTTLLSRDERFR